MPLLFRRLTLFVVAITLLVELSRTTLATEDVPSELYVTAEMTSNALVDGADGERYYPDLFYRETLRQALLLCAREHFQLVARDGALREPLVPDDPNSQVISVAIRTSSGKYVGYDIKSREQTLLAGKVEYNFSSRYSGEALLVDRALEWALGDVAKMLEAQGYKRLTVDEASYDDTEVPAELETQLEQLDILSQYLAVRNAHAAIKKQGASLGLHNVLVRGYANLAQLCEFFPTQMRMAFASRAELYAAWMVTRRPQSPHAYWARAYAFIIGGRHWAGEWELKKAAELADAELDDVADEPAWLPLFRLAIAYDYQRLAEVSREEGALQELATLMWFRSVEFSGSDSLVLETGKQCLKRLPNCTRITNGMHRVAGVSYRHLTSVVGFSQSSACLIENVPDFTAADKVLATVVESVEVKPRNLPSIRRLCDALRAASPTDESSLPLGVLAALIEDDLVLAIIQRADFLRDSLGMDSSEFLTSTRPFYRNHPHALLIDTLELKQNSTAKNFEAIVGAFEPVDGNILTVRDTLVWRMPKETKLAVGTAGQLCQYLHGTASTREAEYVYRLGYTAQGKQAVTYANWLGEMVPNSPFRMKMYAKFDWENRKQDAEWIESVGRHPAVAVVLANQFKNDGDYVSAERWYKSAIQEAPDYDAYRQLAALYWNHLDQQDRAIEVAEEFLTKEDYGLQHSSLSKDVAYSLLSQGRGKEALPWGKRAADAYSYQGLMTLATCLEDQGELAKAEEICRAVDERYQASELFSFVARTGHGDLEAAWKLKQAMLRESTAATAASRKRSEANYKLYSGKLAEASRLYEELVEEFPNSHSCLQLAALADELGQPEARDEWWRRALETKEGVESNDWYASQMAAALLTNPADFTPVIAGIGKHGGDPYFSCYLNLHYYAGRNCECHDRKEEAVKHYTEAARTGFRDEAVEIDAWRRLRKLGGDPSKLQPYWSGLRKYR